MISPDEIWIVVTLHDPLNESITFHASRLAAEKDYQRQRETWQSVYLCKVVKGPDG